MVWLLSHLQNSPGNKIFLDAAVSRGINVKHVDPLGIHLPLPMKPDSLTKNSGPLPEVVFTRMGSSAPLQCLHLLRSLEYLGIQCINSSEAIERSRDKMRTLSILARENIPIPKTMLLGQNLKTADDPARLGEPPWILKFPVSSKGEGVMLINSLPSLRSVAGTFSKLGQDLILQEFIGEAKNSDIRVLVVGGEALASVRRTAQKKDEFRSNVFLGGRDTPERPSADVVRIARAAASALGLDIAGVDILESERGPLVIEVNSSPGLNMMVKPGRVDIPGKIIDFLLNA